jgi:hypothetical protein
MELSVQKTSVKGKYCWTIIKPSADNLQNIVFNEGHPLPDQAFGYGTLDYLNGGIVAAYDGTAPGVGDSIGCASGAWTMKSGNTGFTALFADDTNKICGIQPAGGGGGAGMSIVQAVSGGVDSLVSVKSIALLANPAAHPNFEQVGDSMSVRYLQI